MAHSTSGKLTDAVNSTNYLEDNEEVSLSVISQIKLSATSLVMSNK